MEKSKSKSLSEMLGSVDTQSIIDDALNQIQGEAKKLDLLKYPHDGNPWDRIANQMIKRIPHKYGVVQPDSVTYEMLNAIAQGIHDSQMDQEKALKGIAEDVKHIMASMFGKALGQLKTDIVEEVKKMDADDRASFMEELGRVE